MKSFRPALLLYALPALALALAPGLHASLLYDRAAILHGDWWRLWTGHWVHFSPSHLAWNLLVLLAGGAGLEKLRPGWLLRFTPAAALLISVILLLGEPALQVYGGLSGLATGVVLLLALAGLGRGGRDRAWWCGLLVLVAAKLAFEASHPGALFADFGTQAIRSAALAHAAGAAAALGFFLLPPTNQRAAPEPSPLKSALSPTNHTP